MNLLSLLHRPALLTLTALATLGACSKDDEATPAPAPDQARVVLVHDAANLSTFPIKLTVGTSEGPAVTYGTNSSYQNVSTGVLEIKTNIAAAGGALLNTDVKTLGKDKSYSYFVFSGVGQPANTALGVWAEDDLSAPTTGTAKVRLVHVGQGLVSPLGLSKPGSTGMLEQVVPTTTTGTASAFVSIPAGTASYNLVNTNNNTIVPAAGASVLATNFTAGNIYTIVIRGSSTPATTNEQFTLDLITHN
jgi:hypothetical protein